MMSFRESCGLSFFKGVLLPDPSGILAAAGENSRSARIFRATSLAEIATAADALTACIHAAIEVEKRGEKVALPPDDFDLPEELVAALEADPGLAAARDALTPGRRRGYALHFSEPKQSATRAARIARKADRIRAGKGIHDR